MQEESAATTREARAGERWWIVGDLYTFKATGADTGGAYTALEMLVSPGNGTPLHTHTREDEAFYVQEGEIEFTLGERTVVGKAGMLVHAPRGIPHRFMNASGEPARMLMWAIPAGIEAFFAEIGQRSEDPSESAPPPDVARILAVAPRYGMIISLPE